MSYLLDANTLIEAKNRYYHMAICPGYWHWLQLKHKTGEIASIDSVADELLRSNDELTDWVTDHKDLFLPVSDDPTQQIIGFVADHMIPKAALPYAASAAFLPAIGDSLGFFLGTGEGRLDQTPSHGKGCVAG